MNTYIHEELIHAIVDSCKGDVDDQPCLMFLKYVRMVIDAKDFWITNEGLADINKEGLSEYILASVSRRPLEQLLTPENFTALCEERGEEVVRAEIRWWEAFPKTLYDFIVDLWELYDINLDILKIYFKFLISGIEGGSGTVLPYVVERLTEYSLEDFKIRFIGRENEEHISSSWVLTFNIDNDLISIYDYNFTESDIEITSDEDEYEDEDETVTNDVKTIKENISEMMKNIEDIQDNDGIMNEGKYLKLMDLCKAIYDQS